MWGAADRFTKTLSDFTVGTVIVLVHVALADWRAKPQRALSDQERAANPTTRTGS